MKIYGMKSLADRANVARSSLYNLAKGENFESETLEKVSTVLNVEFGLLNKVPAHETVCNHLAFYKAPLVLNNSEPITMSLEETLKWGLQLSKVDGLLESIVPYFLYLNFKKINKIKLITYLDKEYLFQLLGYYLELVNIYASSKEATNFLTILYRKDFQKLFFGIEKPSDRELEVLKLKKNLVAKKWNVMSLGSSEDYFKRFRKWDKIV
jgi:hypothetical protein